MKTAPLDRRVLVRSEFGTAEMPLSALHANPFVVLLGEPGLGKSTALAYEADAEGLSVLTCREAMNGVALPVGGTVFLDALDEYRSGESRADKLLLLANALVGAQVSKWRLTCRAEDWRDAADLKAMQRAAGEEEIVVAHLLPLRADEVIEVLAALDADDPAGFVRQAQARGAAAFLESPLSLSLLHSVVVSGGVWPASRFELFERAVDALSHEYNPERLTEPSLWGAPVIIETAGKLCFFALATGGKAIWRATSIAPRDHLSLGRLGILPGLAQATLDTALFRGEGHSFWPFHRTVAEFLAGRFLAATCAGHGGAPALPLRRATALITGRDGKAPSELRGLYAWFTAHLHGSDRNGALRLIEMDAPTVLAYGDAAAFDAQGRRTILANLDKDDPYFLSSQDEATVLGGLAGEDMAEIFAEVLDRDEKSHLHITVMRALTEGPAVKAMEPKLAAMAVDPQRLLWMRERAAEIVVKAADDRVAKRRSLLDQLATLPLDAASIMVRAQLLSDALPGELKASDIRALLADFRTLLTTSDDDDVADRGALNGLAWAMRSSGPRDLFNLPIDDGSGSRLRERWQIKSFIDQTLAGTILCHLDADAETLWRWIRNARGNAWEMLEGPVAEAIGEWLDCDPAGRELALFLAIAHTQPDHDHPWLTINEFRSMIRRPSTPGLTEALLEIALEEGDVLSRRWYLELTAYLTRASSHWDQWRPRIVSSLSSEPDSADFIAELLSDRNSEARLEEAARIAQEKVEADEARAEAVADLTPRLEIIASGSAEVYGTLRWAASHYLDAVISQEAPPFSKIALYTSEEIAASIATGLVRFSIDADLKLDAEGLGRAAAKLGTYNSEVVVSTGMHQALLQGREDELNAAPILHALIGLRQSYFAGEDRVLLWDWSIRRLAADPAEGAQLILRYWNSAIDDGDEDLSGLDRLMAHDDGGLVRACLLQLLDTRPDLPAPALRQALTAASSVLSLSELSAFSNSRSQMDNLSLPARQIWDFVTLVLDPEGKGAEFPDDRIEAALLAPEGQLVEAMHAIGARSESLDLLRIAVLASRHDAREDDWHNSDKPSSVVRAAIRRVSTSKVKSVGDTLKMLASKVRASWSAAITHAAADHARMMRDVLYVPPDPETLLAAVSGGRPASPEDLNAIVLEELERFRAGLRTVSERPWKPFWNTDRYGAATSPKIENDCRDYLLGLMRPRLERYQIVDSLPEAQRGESTRADILLLSHAGKNLPVEAKRHQNPELWTAPLEQLAGYADDANAHGYGVYLVFWFGTEHPVPSRGDGAPAPTTANALEDLLRRDLPAQFKDKLSVVVLDVSRPQEMIKAVSKRRGRTKKD